MRKDSSHRNCKLHAWWHIALNRRQKYQNIFMHKQIRLQDLQMMVWHHQPQVLQPQELKYYYYCNYRLQQILKCNCYFIIIAHFSWPLNIAIFNKAFHLFFLSNIFGWLHKISLTKNYDSRLVTCGNQHMFSFCCVHLTLCHQQSESKYSTY
jgi:hypothetical protein